MRENLHANSNEDHREFELEEREKLRNSEICLRRYGTLS
jgi:hypothetical protein